MAHGEPAQFSDFGAAGVQAALQEPLGQRVVVAPDQAVPLHRILLTLHKETSIQPGQVLWCSQHTHSADLHRFLKCVECHRYLTTDDCCNAVMDIHQSLVS